VKTRDQLIGVVLLVDPKRVNLDQDLEHLVVQRTVLSLETLARRSAWFGFIHHWQAHRTAVSW
jgi:hypothetical protein